MVRRPAFIDVLDAMLTERVSGSADRSRTSPRVVATSPLSAFAPFLRPNRFWSFPGPYATGEMHAPQEAIPTSTSTVAPPTPDVVAPEPPPRRRPAPEPRRVDRVLNPAEESALETLIRLGASLDRAFTARELRSAFRELAHRYHPDRHPHASDSECMRLGAAFAELTSAYGILLSSRAQN